MKFCSFFRCWLLHPKLNSTSAPGSREAFDIAMREIFQHFFAASNSTNFMAIASMLIIQPLGLQQSRNDIFAQNNQPASLENFSLSTHSASKPILISGVISIYLQTTAINRFRANRHRRETNCSRRTRRRFEVALERQIPQVSVAY